MIMTSPCAGTGGPERDPPRRRSSGVRFPDADFLAALESRLQNGEHLALYGPRGSGKSTVLAELERRLARERVPCGRSQVTTSLGDVTSALARAYPAVDILEVTQRTARYRLWAAADRRAGVLLLDHLDCASNAMVSFLRRLHGRIVGVLSAVDVDNHRERQSMKPWRFGALSVRMPLAPARRLRRLLQVRRESLRLPPLEPEEEYRLVAAAKGRPGWIVRCTELAREGRYWRDSKLFLTVLCTDTEAAVRYGALDLVRPAAPQH